MWSLTLVTVVFLRLLSVVCSQGINEPQDGQLYLGAWLDTSVAGADSPVNFNNRMGFLASAFQLSQSPIVQYDAATGLGGEINETLIELTGSNAFLVLTVYPVGTFDFVATSDYEALGKQIARYMAAPYNRQVFLRFAPEMNGNWYDYGVQPTEFIDNWKTMYTTVKKAAPNVAIVWSPYSSEGYPWGMVLGNIQSDTTRTALDTNRNNQLDSADDAYSAYYPGDDYVDWNGISYYYKGMQSPYMSNIAPPAGTPDGGLTGNSQITPNGLSLTFTNFYQNYCSTKPCMLSESGAAWHANLTGTNTGTTTQDALQQAWYSGGICNSTFLTSYPKLKMINLYEQQRVEGSEYDLRDYRLTFDDTIRSGFLSSFAAVQNQFVLAAATSIPSDLTGSNPTLDGVSGTASGTPSSTYVYPSQTKDPNVFTGAAVTLNTLPAFFMSLGVVIMTWSFVLFT